MKETNLWVWKCPKCGCEHYMHGGINIATGLVCKECGYAHKNYSVKDACRYCEDISGLEDKGHKVSLNMCDRCKKDST